MNITVIGLGKLGSCLAAMLAENRYKVTGVDTNKKTIDLINSQKAPVNEPGLSEVIKKAGKNLQACVYDKGEIETAELIFVIVPTPSKKNGKFSLEYISKACENIGERLKKSKQKYPVIVITSTVLPGDCEKHLIPILEKMSGKKCGKDFGLCYNPEFIALGSVIKDMKNPDLVLIGESDNKSGDILEKVYKKIVENGAPIKRMNIINSEIVKLSINTFVTTKISYANMLTQICHNTSGADIGTITDTIGTDKRIGKKYLQGGGPYGGPCFPRDNKAFVKMASEKNVDAFIAKATDKMNNTHIDFILNVVQKSSSKIKSIGLLGMSYKPGTPVIEESSGIKLATSLLKKKYKVFFYDKLVEETGVKNLQKESSIKDLIKKNEMIIILNNEPVFKNILPSEVPVGKYILDCWRILDTNKWIKHKNLIQLGIGKK